MNYKKDKFVGDQLVSLPKTDPPQHSECSIEQVWMMLKVKPEMLYRVLIE